MQYSSMDGPQPRKSRGERRVGGAPNQRREGLAAGPALAATEGDHALEVPGLGKQVEGLDRGRSVARGVESP